jgi:hypothetical protein
MAQVGALPLSGRLDETHPPWSGPDPTLLAPSDIELTDLGVERPQRAAAADVPVRAAIGADAQLRILPADTADSPAEGVGALLRYTAPGAQT